MVVWGMFVARFAGALLQHTSASRGCLVERSRKACLHVCIWGSQAV